MRRVHVLVEGPTEETFVGRCVAPHLEFREVYLTTTIHVTRRVPDGPDYKGGLSSWAPVERKLRLLLGDSNATAVTTLLDYYGLPKDTPGMADRPSGTARDKAAHVEAAINASLDSPRMHAHLLVHEFEALLYTDPDACGGYLGNSYLASTMHKAVAVCSEPEFVNDSPQTAPSKRILEAHPSYRKTADGPAIAERIGIDAMRAACPHFNEWMTLLESLSP